MKVKRFVIEYGNYLISQYSNRKNDIDKIIQVYERGYSNIDETMKSLASIHDSEYLKSRGF